MDGQEDDFSVAATFRHAGFKKAATINLLFNIGINLFAIYLQITGTFTLPVSAAPHIPFFHTIHIGSWGLSLLVDILATSFAIALFAGYFGAFQPIKDLKAGTIPPVRPHFIRRGAFRLFPSLPMKSLFLRSLFFGLQFGAMWAGPQLAVLGALCSVKGVCSADPVAWAWSKAFLAGIEAVIVTAFIYPAACAADATLISERGALLPAGGSPGGAELVRDTARMARAEADLDAAVQRDGLLAAEARDAEQDMEASLATAPPATTRSTASPLNIAILTVGTRGDVQPFVAVALALQQAGHRPTICTTRDFRAFVQDYGIPYADGGVERIEQPAGWLDASHIGEMFRATASQFERFYDPMARAFTEATRGADLIICTAMTVSFALDLAEKQRAPVLACKLAPDIPTRAFPPPGMSPSACGCCNKLKHYVYWARVGIAAGQTRLTELENTFRRDVLGLPPFNGRQRLADLGTVPTLLGVSPSLLPAPADWPASVRVGGFWFLDGPPSSALPDRVADFLSAGPPPVCVTFGSMVLVHRAGVLRTVLDACAALNQRVILITGWAEPPQDLPPSVLCVPGLPHEQIFPRCRAVVFHGGAGTTARVLHAGVPALVIPILRWTDQPLYGSRCEAVGAGKCVMDPTRDAVQRALVECLDPTGSIRYTAKGVGARIRAEEKGALEQVVRLSEHLVAEASM